jgi:hypothetical protein
VVDFSERLRIWVRCTVIRAQHYPLLKQLFRWACRLGTWQIGRLLMKTPGIETVYIRHTHPNSPSFVPGHSDLDLTIVLTEDTAMDPNQIGAVSCQVAARKLFYYYLNPQDVRFTTRKELARVTRVYPSPYELLYTPDDWVLLAGEEVRTTQPRGFPKSAVPWHPEFNKWWQHLLQNYLLIKMSAPDDQYVRIFYRGALKQQLHFLAASGKGIARPPGHLDDSLVEVAFRENSEVQALLSDLKRRHFRDKDAQYLKERIFWHTIRSAADFFRTYPFPPEVNSSEPLPQEDQKLHARAYEVLESRLAQCPWLSRWLKGVLAYPIPHCYPYFYQVDFVIPDGLSVEEFSKLINSMKETFQTFQAREFHLDGRGYSVGLVLESIYNWPLVFLGSPFPFLREHIRRYGKCLMGPLPKALKGDTHPNDLVEWCRVFLPYYMFNLSRRLEYSSRTLNFCQLASIRLFLETGEMETDPLVLRKRRRERFKYESPDNLVWSYTLKGKSGRQTQSAYRAATFLLLKDCQRVETLLEKNKSVAV